MSISVMSMAMGVALSPALMITRAIMGKQRYEQWINSGVIKYKVALDNPAQLADALRKAGYDFVPFAGRYKTHFSDKKDDFFWWCIEAEGIFAEFFKRDERYLSLISAVEKAVGMTLFSLCEGTANLRESNVPFVPQNVPTLYTDSELLMETLYQFGVTPQQDSSGKISFEINGLHFILWRNREDQPFFLSMQGTTEQDATETLLQLLNDDYTRLAQQRAYRTVRQNCVVTNSVIEQETILEDDSIVLTISVL